MKLIITGATGSLGAFLTKHFFSQGHEIIAYGRSTTPPKNLLQYATYKCADITQKFKLEDADCCIHTAALSDDKATPKQLYLPNVIGTKNIADGTKTCKKFIHISSSSIYIPDNNPITEEMAGKQNNKLLSPYGKSKLLAEEMLYKTTQHEACFVLRPRAFYGAGDCVILPRILKLLNGTTFQRPGAMQVSVSMTHYRNIAKAIELCMLSEKKGINVYNVADDTKYILVDVIRKILHQLCEDTVQEKEIKIWVLKLLSVFKVGGITPLLVRSFTKNMVLDTQKIKKELAYESVCDFDSQLSELAQWVEKIGGIEAIKTGNKKFAWH